MSNIKKTNFTLYTDGGCRKPQEPGAWAFVLVDMETQVETRLCKGCYSTTNNRMELLAVIRGLESIPTNSVVSLVSDSEYVVKGIKEWLPRWKAKNWTKLSSSKPIQNLDLWQQLDVQLQRHEVQPTWVKGHSNHKYNEICDQLATRKIEDLVERINDREGKDRE